MTCDSSRYFLNISPSPEDDRDFKYQQSKIALRQSVDLRMFDTLVEDQSYLGSCVGSALTNAYEILVNILYPDRFVELSDLYVYYNSRLYDNTISTDTGAYIRDGLKSMAQYGCCSEELWPYDISKFDVRPTPECYIDGAQRLVTRYESLYTLRDMLEVLSNDQPVVIGTLVYDSFMTLDARSPVVQLPKDSDIAIGAHAMVLVGYDLDRQQFLAKNSFGTDWGMDGYCWIPFEYVRTQVFEKWRFDINSQELIDLDAPPVLIRAHQIINQLVVVSGPNGITLKDISKKA
jgi:hypothetical protein